MFSKNRSTKTVVNKHGIAHVYSYKSKITVVGVNSHHHSIVRLSSGQDINRKKCPCDQSSTSPSRYYNQTNPSDYDSVHCTTKCENGHFEEWQKNNSISREDERADMFCLCNDTGVVGDGSGFGGGIGDQTATDNLKEVLEPKNDIPNGAEPVAHLDSAEDERRTRLKPFSPHERNTNRSKSAPKVRLNANEKANRSTVKKRKRTKKKCMCTRIARAEDSFIDDVKAEKPMKTTHVVYPGVCCGHKNCQSHPIVTPKTMGWLWSLRETGGVKINRNWRPGAIPKNVAILMERVRAETTGEMGRHNLKATHPIHFNNQYPSSSWSRTTVESNKKFRNNRNAVIISDDQKSTQLQNNNNNNSTTNIEPVFVMSKHKGQYGIKMNPMSYKEPYGVSKNEEPVQIRLGPHSRRNTTISSQSSMELELIPQNVLNKPK